MPTTQSRKADRTRLSREERDRMVREWCSRAGKARMAALSPAERTDLGRAAVQSRWENQTPEQRRQVSIAAWKTRRENQQRQLQGKAASA